MLILGLNRIMEPIEVRCHVARQFDPGISILLLRIYPQCKPWLPGDTTSEKPICPPSLLVLCKMLKLLTEPMSTGRVPSTACLLLRQKQGSEGSNNIEGYFFGSSLFVVGLIKRQLTDFRGTLLKGSASYRGPCRWNLIQEVWKLWRKHSIHKQPSAVSIYPCCWETLLSMPRNVR